MEKGAYEEARVDFSEYGFSIAVPSAWLVLGQDETGLLLESEDSARQLGVSVFANTPGYTLDTLLHAMDTDSAYQDVAACFFEEVPFVSYALSEGSQFGCITISADGALLIFFTFSPAEDMGLRLLADRIMRSLSLAAAP